MTSNTPIEEVLEFALECYNDEDLQDQHLIDSECEYHHGFRKHRLEANTIEFARDYWQSCWSFARYHLNGQERKEYMESDRPPGVGI